MSFNQQSPNFSSSSGMNANTPQQQQQQRGGNLPALTPQMLQSLTPQQFQLFRSNPQFQEVMNQYMQKQQLLQQQQQGLPHLMNGIPNQPQANPQFRQQVVANQMPPNMVNVPGSQTIINQPIHGANIPINKVPSRRMSSIPGIPGGQNPPVGVPGGAGPPLAGVPGATPLVPGQGPARSVGGVLATGVPNPGGVPSTGTLNGAHGNAGLNTNLPPGVTPEILNKVPMKPMQNVKEWSEKLKQEGKDVPLDLKVYEDLIRKDTEFVGKLNKQLHDNKFIMENINRDIKSYNQIKQLRMNSIALSNKGQYNNSIWGEGYQGYGNGITNSSTKLFIPNRDLTDRIINERVMKNKNKPKHYVPIRLEFDQERDQFKLRDTFLWDLNEEIIKVEDFTAQLLEDYKFISKVHYETILSSIKEQIADYLQKPSKTMGELRIPIKIDITINNTQLTDQFEWDILNSQEGDAEEFSSYMCDELCLPGEFCTAIAHSIREQSQMYYKALNMVGYGFDGSPVHEDEIRNHLLPPLRLVSSDSGIVDDFFSILRNPSSLPDFSPTLGKLSQLEVERLDKEMERESRRKRRHNYNEDQQQGSGRGFTSRRIAAHAGRGNTIPDLSDIPKTFRTPAPSSILPGAVDMGVPEVYEYNEVLINRTQVRNPDYRPPTPIRVENELVDYNHDPIEGTFMVTIKLPV